MKSPKRHKSPAIMTAFYYNLHQRIGPRLWDWRRRRWVWGGRVILSITRSLIIWSRGMLNLTQKRMCRRCWSKITPQCASRSTSSNTWMTTWVMKNRRRSWRIKPKQFATDMPNLRNCIRIGILSLFLSDHFKKGIFILNVPYLVCWAEWEIEFKPSKMNTKNLKTSWMKN